MESTDASRLSAKGGGEHSFSFLRSPISIGNNLGVYLQEYFRSGWAFFIPYLAAYLLYAWLRWPVNPAAAGERSIEQGAGGWVPSLLHVYWVLHAVHIVLGAIAMRFWLRHTSLLHSPLSLLLKAAPWLLLALLFYIPGIYLEWPSDPWEHLRRINEWRILDQVTAHSSWKKSSYFLPYSLTQHVTGLTQISWLNFYYTAVCLLLSWQYYRLARSVELGERAAFVFVLLNAVTFGNNIFSFYRYYGLSSSILAQLGAVALVRIVVLHWANPDAGRDLRTVYGGQKTSSMRMAFASALAAALIAATHLQGLAIASILILATATWRISVWQKRMLPWLCLTAIAASVATIAWFSSEPSIAELRQQGWLGIWSGFNLVDFSSPAAQRTIQILGNWGVASSVVAAWLLLARNHLVAWLTLSPLLALLIPAASLPIVNELVRRGSADGIVVFHRLLFAVPACLSLVLAGSMFFAYAQKRILPGNRTSPAAAAIVLVTFLLIVTVAGYSRLWHALSVPPADLSLCPVIQQREKAIKPLDGRGETLRVAAPLIAAAQHALLSNHPPRDWRVIRRPVEPSYFQQIFDWLSALSNTYVVQPTDSLDTAVDIRRLPLPESTVPAGFSAPNRDWITLSGHPAIVLADTNRVEIRSPPGKPSYPFTDKLIPVDPAKRLRISVQVRQWFGPPAKVYLAVAWYDGLRRPLISNKNPPEGAGAPAGWTNGTYSYFGLTGGPAPRDWSSYTIDIGLGEKAAIPDSAAFMRIGALLNYEAANSAEIGMRNLVLQEKPAFSRLQIAWPSVRWIFSPMSQAGFLSGHWHPQEVASQAVTMDSIERVKKLLP